jgi:hypothetical protein
MKMNDRQLVEFVPGDLVVYRLRASLVLGDAIGIVVGVRKNRQITDITVAWFSEDYGFGYKLITHAPQSLISIEGDKEAEIVMKERCPPWQKKNRV